jgi:hypothetical protein
MHIPKGKIVLTYEDYVLLPNDRNRYEILQGELTVTPAPSTKHQSASANLFKLLHTSARSSVRILEPSADHH